jgi:hypothetical protein
MPELPCLLSAIECEPPHDIPNGRPTAFSVAAGLFIGLVHQSCSSVLFGSAKFGWRYAEIRMRYCDFAQFQAIFVLRCLNGAYEC